MSVHPGSDIAPAQPTPAAEGASTEMKFRALRVGGDRKGFRLENPFWLALQIVAREKGRTLEEEVQSRLQSAAKDANHSSLLRVGAVEDLISYWQLAESRAARLQWNRVLEASPTPAFALTEGRQIFCVNSALVQAIRGHRLSAEAPPTAVSIDLPAQPVGEALRSASPITTTAVFRSDPFRFSSRVRLVGHINGAGNNRLLIGFVEPASA